MPALAIIGLLLLDPTAQTAPAPIQAPSYEQVLQAAQLAHLPQPILLPRYLPPSFQLVDVRLQERFRPKPVQPLQTYALVYGNAQSSLLLQVDLPAMAPACQTPAVYETTLWSLNRPQTWVGSRRLRLFSPACDLQGKSFAQQALPSEDLLKVWKSLQLGPEQR